MKINVILGLSALLITFCFSLANNTWQVSLFRSGIGFVLFFILGYLIRITVYQKASKTNSKLGNEEKDSDDIKYADPVKLFEEDQSNT